MNPHDKDQETLVLYYYNDGLSPDERRRVADRLNHDSVMRREYEQLCSSLDDIGSLDALHDGAGRRERLLGTIDQLARDNDRPIHPAANSGGWLLGLALAATLVVGIAIGLRLDRSAEDPGTSVAATTSSDSEPLARRVTNHLRSSQQSLLDITSRSDPERLLLVRDIVTRNRSFAEKARAQGDDQLARLLRAFEPLLLELAAGGASADDEALLRTQLLFELNVVLTKYGHETSNEAEAI